MVRYCHYLGRLATLLCIVAMFSTRAEAQETPGIVLPTQVTQGVKLGQSGTESLAIENDGDGALVISGTTLSGQVAPFEIVDLVTGNPLTFPFTVDPGNTRSIGVKCSPTESNIFRATVTFQVTGALPNDADTEVELVCGGLWPVVISIPTMLPFGNQRVGVESAAVNVGILNINGAQSIDGHIQIVSPGAASRFKVESSECVDAWCPIPKNETRTMNVSFAPALGDEGLSEETITIKVSAANVQNPGDSSAFDTTVVVGLSGNGVTPPSLDVASTTIDFGKVTVASSRPSEDIVVGNSGDQTLQIFDVALRGDDPDEFTVTPTTKTATLNSGDTKTWSVACKLDNPSDDPKEALLVFTSNDPSGADVSNDGRYETEISLSCEVRGPILVVTPSTVQFEDTACDGDSLDKTITLRNNGNEEFVGMVVSSNSKFSVEEIVSPGRLDEDADNLVRIPVGNESATVRVRFKPVAAGDSLGTLSIIPSPEGSDPGGIQTVSLLGPARFMLDVSPMPVDFGTLASGDRYIETVTLTNTGDPDLDGDIVIESIRIGATEHFTVLDGGRGALAPQESRTFGIAARLSGERTVATTLTVETDIEEGCGESSIVVAVKAASVLGDADVSPSPLNFGTHDVASANKPQLTTNITKRVDRRIEIVSACIGAASGFTCIENSPFSIIGDVPEGELPKDVAVSLTVQYDPTKQSTRDTGSLIVVLDKEPIEEGPSETVVVTVDLFGVAIDREIVATPQSLSFGSIFRGPAEPLLQTVEIMNGGDAPLDVSAVELCSAESSINCSTAFSGFSVPIFEPFTIAPRGSKTVTVSFQPAVAGALTAILVVKSDDRDRPVCEVSLSGTSIAPIIALSINGSISLGETGFNVPVSLQSVHRESLRVVNREDQDFTIREIRLVDPDGNVFNNGPFRVIGFEPGQVLAVGDSLDLDVEFLPAESGTHVAVLEVYVDQDEQRVAALTITANANDVKVRGGGCSASGGMSQFGAWIVLLGLLLFARRRVWAIALVLFVASGPAFAQPTRNLDLRTFTPDPGVEANMFSVVSPEVGESKTWTLGVFLNHAVNPLKVASGGMEEVPVSGRTSADIAFSYAFADRFEAGLVLPMVLQSGDTAVFSGLQTNEGAVLGDIALHAKARLMTKGRLTLGSALEITLPTASDEEFAGSETLTAHGRLLFGLTKGRVALAANTGFRLRGKGELGDIEQGHEFTYGLGAAYAVTPNISAVVEGFGRVGVSNTEGVSPVEATAGGRFNISKRATLALGIGRGLVSGIGAPDLRGFFMLSFVPHGRRNDYQPHAKVVLSQRQVEKSIAPELPACPSGAKRNRKGKCVKTDRDGDGIADAFDLCPTRPEDLDSFQDTDGCPEIDNDGDGLVDHRDKCPVDREDPDGFEDSDGCPELDNDRDGIVDTKDQCPLKAEVINGKADQDGCPDEGESLVLVLPDRIETFEPVRFVRKTSRVKRTSHNVLSQVAATLRANRDFVRVRISAHVHPSGSKDVARSRKRAKAVRDWLIRWGIRKDRLDIKGNGSERLLVPRSNRDSRRINNRVEFLILEKRVNP